MEFLKRTWAEISIPALLHNFDLIKNNCNYREVIAVVKTDAYGHNAPEIALALQNKGVENFAVSNLEEALELRHSGITKPIMILGYTPVELADTLIENDIIQAVFSEDYAKNLSNNATKGKIKVHIKIDTGMNRIGFDYKSIDEILSVYSLNNFSVTGIFTHFCVADSKIQDDISFTCTQMQRFDSVINKIKQKGYDTGLVHCSNSAKAIKSDKPLYDACRPGIILYGLNPSNEVTLQGLKPVMTLKSVISMVKWINADEVVSYGRTFKAKGKIKVATVTAGYGDGYPRALSNKGQVIVGGKRANIIGRICMDQFMIDVTDIPNVSVSDEVILFGEELTADEVAEKCSTIGYEIVCGINKRVPRIIFK